MKTIKTLLKTAFALFTALAILSALMFGYFFVPVRENNPKQNTDYVWASNTPWVRATEGVSFGKTDGNGFINLSVIENPDIILLGSSHAESMNVMRNENMCALLNEKFDGKYSVYNMGISGHTIYKVLQYLKNSINAYENPPRYVIIETSSVALSTEAVREALSGDVPKTNVIDKGLIADIQKIPYFRHMYHQMNGGMLKNFMDNNTDSNSSASTSAEEKTTDNKTIDEKPYQTTLEYLSQIEKDYGTKIIVMFHPSETLNVDGSISFSQKEYSDVFARYAQKYNVGFVDMTKDFENLYYEEHHVSHGFVTGTIGLGHINKYGHKVIADRLFKYINALEVK